MPHIHFTDEQKFGQTLLTWWNFYGDKVRNSSHPAVTSALHPITAFTVAAMSGRTMRPRKVEALSLCTDLLWTELPEAVKTLLGVKKARYINQRRKRNGESRRNSPCLPPTRQCDGCMPICSSRGISVVRSSTPSPRKG